MTQENDSNAQVIEYVAPLTIVEETKESSVPTVMQEETKQPNEEALLLKNVGWFMVNGVIILA